MTSTIHESMVDGFIYCLKSKIVCGIDVMKMMTLGGPKKDTEAFASSPFRQSQPHRSTTTPASRPDSLLRR